MGGCANLILADDPEAAWARIAPHLAFQWQTYFEYAVEGDRAPSRRSPIRRLRFTEGPAMLPTSTSSPRPRRWRGCGPGWPSCRPARLLLGLGRRDGDDLVDRHVELLAEELAPALSGR